MNESRDSIQTTLGVTLVATEVTSMRRDIHDLNAHIDRLYEQYHDLWDCVNKLSEGIAQTVPLPLKYK